jgi:hypothetical protein
MPDIDRAVLYDRCSTPRDRLFPETALLACDALGGLSRWWLTNWVFDSIRGTKKAKEYPDLVKPERPQFPDKPGSCWVVFCNEEPDKLPMLGAGCLLPLCWKRGPHSRSLPKTLRDVADQVVESLAYVPEFNARWGLHLADLPRFDAIRLHDDLPLGYSSGWASLAGGLITFVKDLKPQGAVWATGAWKKDFGLVAIDGLKEKLTLAREWKTKHFFVPDSESQTQIAWEIVKAIAPDLIEIGTLRSTAELDPMKTLNQYLAKLASVPDDPEKIYLENTKQFEARREYYFHQDSKTARDYYREHLLPAIVWRCQERYNSLPVSRIFSHFVTIVSKHNELAIINPLVVRAEKCLLLYHDLEAEAKECQRILESQTKPVTCYLRRFPMGTELAHVLATAVTEFTLGVPPDRVALDLTPGTKLMSYSLSLAAKPGNWLFCLEVDYPYDRYPDGRPDPGSERPGLLPVRY